MNGPELLEHAAGLVNRRRREYGEPADLFEQIAQRWSLTLATTISAAQVALCLIDFKLARLTHDPRHLGGSASMNGPELLDHAAGLVNRRRREYGEPVELFEHVAQRWSLTLGNRVSPAQVVLCLIDLKLARLAHDPKHLDGQVDIAGYAAVLREVSR